MFICTPTTLSARIKTILSHLAGDGWAAQENRSVIFDRQPHQVLSRLVFRAAKTTVSPHKGGLPCRSGASSQRVC